MYSVYQLKDNTNNNIYIGQTKQGLSTRISKHKTDFKTIQHCSSRLILVNNDYTFKLIQADMNEKEATILERHLIRNTDNCINKIKYDLLDKDKYDKLYYLKNQNKRVEYQKNRHKYISSWGGDLRSNLNNNLLKIDPYLFV